MHPCTVGSWKTTRSIGRECTAGDRRSRPVLTAKRLDHPDPPAPPQLVVGRAGPRRGRDLPEVSRHPPTRVRREIDGAPPPYPAGPGIGTRLRDRPTAVADAAAGVASSPAGRFPGDDTGGATPVPIPNTAVKPVRPMIVPSSAKVGHRRDLYSPPAAPLPHREAGGFFLRWTSRFLQGGRSPQNAR